MSKNILELKSIGIAPEKVVTPESAQRVRRLKDFDLKEEYFQPVYHPADLVEDIGQWKVVRSYGAEVPVADIKGTTHPSYYGLNWLQMLMSPVYYEEFQSVEAAFERERQLHGWSQAKKEALIHGEVERLAGLSAGRMAGPSTSSGTVLLPRRASSSPRLRNLDK